MRAHVAWNPCVFWDELQTVAPSARTSATPQEGPMEPCVWMGQRYEALSVRVPGGGALNAELSPRLAISWSRTMRLARIDSHSFVGYGSRPPPVRFACNERDARNTVH